MDHPRRTALRREPAARRARRRAGQLPGWVAGPAGASALRLANRVVGATLVGAVLASGVAQLHESRDADARAAAAVAETRAHTAERVEARRVERVAHAATARLTGEAVRYAAVRRAEALTAARTAVQAAQAVVVSTSASPDVPAATLTPLGEATARLTALIEATPDVPPPLARPTRVAPGTVRSLAAGTVTVTGRRAVPADDAGVQPVADVDVVTPPAPAAEPTPATAGAAPAAAAPTTAPAAAPGDAAPGDLAPADPGPAAVVPAPRAATAMPAAADADPAPDAPEVAVETLQTLDLAVSAGVLAAAHQLTELSVQAQASADAAVAAAQAARRAAEEAARAEAAALAERVAAVDAAPNGQVPTELLCPVEVAPDALLRCDAAAALDRLAVAYRADVGRRLDVVSSYRSFDAQVAVKATRGGLAATPGRSNHGRALAVDLGGFGGVGDFTAPAYLWMKEHAAEFGWHHPAAMEPGGSAPQEPWHWEFDTED